MVRNPSLKARTSGRAIQSTLVRASACPLLFQPALQALKNHSAANRFEFAALLKSQGRIRPIDQAFAGAAEAFASFSFTSVAPLPRRLRR
jgi:hypothetical protein